MKTRADHRGFTLIEVMVAVVVVAVTLPALVSTLQQQIDGTAYLRDKSIAQWVANNKLAENRIRLARNGSLERGERSGSETMAGRDWYWETTSQPTEVEDFWRLEIRVGLGEEATSADEPLYTLVGFLYVKSGDGGR